MGAIMALDERATDAEPDMVVEPGDDVRLHGGLGNVAVIAISFPKFREGRGYSSARILREMGFAGDVRAVGDLTVDQLVFLRRAGFSSVEALEPIDAALAARVLARFPAVYQRGADPAVPAWVQRGEPNG